MEFVGETLRAALEALAAAAPSWLESRFENGWAQRYCARIDSWRFPRANSHARSGCPRSAVTDMP